MTETDFDTQAETALPEQETEAKLPWESIDPDEAPAPFISPFASTAISAVGAGKRQKRKSRRQAARLLNRFTRLENEVASSIPEEEREEQLADRAFFSDQKISVEMAKATPKEAAESDSPEGILATAQEVLNAQDVLLERASGSLGSENWSNRTVVEIVDTSVDDVAASAEADPTEIAPDKGIVDAESPIAVAEISTETPGLELSQDEVGVVATIEQEDDSVPVLASFDRSPVESVDEQATPTIADELDEAIAEHAYDLEAKSTETADSDASVTSDDDVLARSILLEQDAGEVAGVTSSDGTFELTLANVDAVSSPVFRAIPADAVHEVAVTSSTSDSLQTAASELAGLVEAMSADEAEQPGDQTVLVAVTSSEDVVGLADAVPELAVAAQTETETEVEVELEPELAAPVTSTGGGWTIPLMCLGIGLIACCMVIPQGESNRKLRYEQAALLADLQHVQKQSEVNDEFLKKVADDPTLAERLAGRQMKTIRKGQKVVDLKQGADDGDMSPFSLVAVAKPAELPAYKPKTGTIANLCNNARSRLYLLGISLAMVAVGLVMGFGGTPRGSDTIAE